jgi:hypothetical protein
MNCEVPFVVDALFGGMAAAMWMAVCFGVVFFVRYLKGQV